MSAPFEPTKARKVGKAPAYVLSQRQGDPDAPWLIVDAAVLDDPRYPGCTAVEAMQASARHRQVVADRLADAADGDVTLFVAVWHHELKDHGVDPDTRITHGARERAAAWQAQREADGYVR